MSHKNPEDKKAYYRRNAEKFKLKASLRSKRYFPQLRQWIKARKENYPCEDCGHRFPYYVMDFDHVRGKKVITIGHATSRGWSIDAIMKEIEKCDLVCSNCHRIRTHTRKQCKDGFKETRKAVMDVWL